MRKGIRILFWIFVVAYSVVVLYKTVFGRPANEEFNYNLLPFWSYLAIMKGEGVNLWLCNYLNIFLFIPFGALLRLALGKMQWKMALVYSCTLSLCVELLQLVLKRGLCEFDDVFHNVLGSMVGYLTVSMFVQLTVFAWNVIVKRERVTGTE